MVSGASNRAPAFEMRPIGLISNAGARFEAPETISAQGRFEDVRRGGYDPEQHLKDMALDGVAGEVLYPSQGLFYFTVADPLLMSAAGKAVWRARGRPLPCYRRYNRRYAHQHSGALRSPP